MRQLERPVEVSGDVLLVRVDENQIERSAPLLRQLGQGFQRVTDPHLDNTLQTRVSNAGLRNFGVLRVNLEGYQASFRPERSRQPDGAVAAEGANLEDGASADHARQQVQEFSQVG